MTPPCSAERIHEGKNEGSTALSSLLLLFFFFFCSFFVAESRRRSERVESGRDLKGLENSSRDFCASESFVTSGKCLFTARYENCETRGSSTFATLLFSFQTFVFLAFNAVILKDQILKGTF